MPEVCYSYIIPYASVVIIHVVCRFKGVAVYLSVIKTLFHLGEQAWLEYTTTMKIVIASDIHGAEQPAARLREIVKEEKPEALLLLGDILYHGPRNELPEGYCPKIVIKILEDLKDMIIAVRGNCDAEVDQMVLPFPIMSECNTLFADNKRIFMTHGHIWSFDKHPEGIDVIMQGHTHIPSLEKRGSLLLLNPGSISLPKGGYPQSYAIWDAGKVEIRELLSGNILFNLQV